MITATEAQRIVIDQSVDFGSQQVSLNQAVGYILDEQVFADRDFPPFHRVAMDGIAINSMAFKSGQREFTIETIAPAGAPQQTLKNYLNCIEVMTGAILPHNTDTVIPVEQIEIKNNLAHLNIEQLKPSQNIHLQGVDCQKEALLLPKGKKITIADIGLLATVGKESVRVKNIPKVAILSTGNELVEVNQKPLPHQIRKSNVHQIGAFLHQWHITPHFFHLPDDLTQITQKLEQILNQFDVLILSGAVSKGKFDYLPDALQSLGVKQLFHRVAQRPGKPFWFGKSNANSVVFAFPGNPLSTFVCMYFYLQPWLNKSLKLQKQPIAFAQLTETINFKPELTYFLPVKIEVNQQGILLAKPVSNSGSGDLTVLSKANAWLILPPNQQDFLEGQAYPCLMF